MSKPFFRVLIVVAAFVALSATPAFAYQESSASTNPSDTPTASCPTCHGLEAGVSSPTVAPTRKGPHGGYTSGTQKCDSCHVVHDSAGESMLLPGATMEETCNTCHDGTGGGGVYGVIAARVPTATVSGHRVGMESISATSGLVNVPGSTPTTFTGMDGALTCTDCHSPHDSNTVAPFVGDRRRSTTDTTATASVASNRLLRKSPTHATAPVDTYGSEWCAACHASSLVNHANGHESATNADGRNYENVQKLTGVNTTTTTTGRLGGDNFGYIMPDRNGAAAGVGHSERPICMQCHEDARSVGSIDASNNPVFSVSTTQTFSAPVDGATTGNPRFQNFPHETVGQRLLIEPSGTALCANCHVLP